MGCHLYLSAHPNEHTEFQANRIGRYKMSALNEMANDMARGRQVRREAKAIAVHFRREHLEMVKSRDSGNAGWIEFAGYL